MTHVTAQLARGNDGANYGLWRHLLREMSKSCFLYSMPENSTTNCEFATQHCLGASRLYFTARPPLLLRPLVAKRRAGPDGSSILECRGSNYKIFVAKTHLYHLQQNISGEGKSQQRKELVHKHKKGSSNLRAVASFIDKKLSYSPVM